MTLFIDVKNIDRGVFVVKRKEFKMVIIVYDRAHVICSDWWCTRNKDRICRWLW